MSHRLRLAALAILVVLVILLPGLRARGQTSGSAVPSPVRAIADQGVTLLTAAPVVSAANTAATVTLTGAAGQRVCLRALAVKATGAAATFTLTVSDGATLVLDLGTQTAALNGAAVLFAGTPLLLCGSPGNNVVVNIGAGGASAVTTTSAIADRS